MVESICSLCGQTFKNGAGLAGHMRQIHGRGGVVLENTEANTTSEDRIAAMQRSYSQVLEQVKALNQRIENLGKVEGKNMDSVLTEKDMRIHQLETELKELREKSALPSFDEFIKHCKTCGDHGKALEEYNENLLKKFIASLSHEGLKQIVEMKGENLMPDKITIRIKE